MVDLWDAAEAKVGKNEFAAIIAKILNAAKIAVGAPLAAQAAVLSLQQVRASDDADEGVVARDQ